MATSTSPSIQGTEQTHTKQHTQKHRSLLVEFLLGGTSTSCACLFSNPFEVIKTRMQVQGEQGAQIRAFRNSFHAFYTISKNEGIHGIQRGLSPAIAYQLCMNGTRLGSYGPIKRLLGVTDEHKSSLTNYFKFIIAGALSGGLSAIVGSPFFLVKVRLQTQASGGTIPLGTQHGYNTKSFGNVIKSIVETEGISGLYRGVTSGVLRVGVGSAAQLSTYDAIKRELSKSKYLNEHGFIGQCVSAFAASFVVVTAMNPFDVIATRMYNQNIGERYHGNWDCLKQIVHTEGTKGLLKGWIAHYARLGPHTILTFLFWERAKSIASTYGY